MDDTEARLNRELLAAHERRDGAALAELYAETADLAEAAGQVDRACFFLVHAYVYALENGHPLAEPVRERLRRHGREE